MQDLRKLRVFWNRRTIQPVKHATVGVRKRYSVLLGGQSPGYRGAFRNPSWLDNIKSLTVAAIPPTPSFSTGISPKTVEGHEDCREDGPRGNKNGCLRKGSRRMEIAIFFTKGIRKKRAKPYATHCCVRLYEERETGLEPATSSLGRSHVILPRNSKVVSYKNDTTNGEIFKPSQIVSKCRRQWGYLRTKGVVGGSRISRAFGCLGTGHLYPGLSTTLPQYATTSIGREVRDPACPEGHDAYLRGPFSWPLRPAPVSAVPSIIGRGGILKTRISWRYDNL